MVAGEGDRLCHLRHLGRLDEVSLAERDVHAAIYALPARYEPFGLSVLEAALSGCALVLGDIPSLREIWDDAAVFVPPDEPRRLEAELRQCIEQPAWRSKIADRAEARARRYTASAMADKYFDLYSELTNYNAGVRLTTVKG